MYEAHFGLAENPFGINPDPRFLYLSETHEEALARLVYGVEQRRGFIVVTGDVGTGKTTLLNRLLQGCRTRTRWVVVRHPKLTVEGFLRTLAHALGLEAEPFEKARFLIGLEALLAECLRRGENVVLVVDEAQDLSAELLEEIRLLSNIETASEKMLQIVLVGQQELNDLLRRHELRQLRQRVFVKYHLLPLAPEETERYVLHRLRVAGAGERPLFGREALRCLHRASGGYPRLINSLCDEALLAAYSRGADAVSGPLMRQTVREVEGSYPSRAETGPPPPQPPEEATPRPGWGIVGAAAAVVAALVLALLALAGLAGGAGALLRLPH